MWKLFEKALGRSESEEPVRDAGPRKQDSGFQLSDSGTATREAGSGNGGAASRVAGKESALERTGDGGVPSPAKPAAGMATPDPADLEGKIKAAMRTVYDPEIPINIYELGLVYGLQIEPEGKVRVQMTLTAPSCPEAQTLPARVQQVIQEVPGVSEAAVELVWEPTWTPQKMSEAARLQLGIF